MTSGCDMIKPVVAVEAATHAALSDYYQQAMRQLCFSHTILRRVLQVLCCGSRSKRI